MLIVSVVTYNTCAKGISIFDESHNSEPSTDFTYGYLVALVQKGMHGKEASFDFYQCVIFFGFFVAFLTTNYLLSLVSKRCISCLAAKYYPSLGLLHKILFDIVKGKSKQVAT